MSLRKQSMKKRWNCEFVIFKITVLSIFLLLTSSLDSSAQSISINASEGWLIYSHGGKRGHRYGPSIIINPDKSIDIWLASTGFSEQWDWIRHKRSIDGGKLWGEETVVLQPTPNSPDRMSVCDPGVIKLGEYYYLGVTAVYDKEGRGNCVFVARSKFPKGPYEKWNGHGWGGIPKSIIEFTGSEDAWGAGEPSFVLKDETLYVYYTWSDLSENKTVINQTRVATAPVDPENWPAKLTFRGIVYDREKAEDSADVKYIDAFGKFIAIATAERFTPSGYIIYRESLDGIHFSKPQKLRERIQTGCHNAGISGTHDGHINLEDENFIAYAYQDENGSWGKWDTFLNPITIENKMNIEKHDFREIKNDTQKINFKQFLQNDVPGTVKFFGSDIAELFTREIEESFKAVLKKNYKTNYEKFMPGYITASVDGRPWHDTMWSRDGGTFLRELVLWGNINHACLLADCLIQLVKKNDEGYYTFPEYFKQVEPASGKELDGTGAIIIGMVHLWERLPENNIYKNKIYEFLHQEFSPVQYIHQKLQPQPLIEGSGEFGGGCGIKGDWYNVVQNNLVRLALIASANMESQAGDKARAGKYQRDAEKISENMLEYLVAEDGSWLWCIDPTIFKPDFSILNHPINKGFGGLNGVASMYADVLGLEPLASDWKGAEISKKTFEQIYAFPLRKEQFEKYGIWSQFDEFREGMSSGPSYGDGYALQTMLLLDKMDMAEKSIAWLANATYQPISEYVELDRESPYYFYERYYSPDIVGKMQLEQGCGALNLVNVTEPLKVARLIVGVDDYSSDEVIIVPRVPSSWTGYEAINWPIQTPKGMVIADLRCKKEEGKITFEINVKRGQQIPNLAIRFVTSKGIVWEKRNSVTHLNLAIQW